MSSTAERLAALRAATQTKAGQTSVQVPKPKSASEKIEIQPLAIGVLTAKAFTGNEKSLYSQDPQLEAKLRLLGAELAKESKLSNFTTALFNVDKAIGHDANVITQLTPEAVKLYCQASKRLVADPSGAKHVEQINMKLKDQMTDQLLALSEDGGDDDDFDLA